MTTDTQRLNKLEKFIKENQGNGIVIFILNNNTKFTIDDLGDEDGSDLGECFCEGKTLRETIDNL